MTTAKRELLIAALGVALVTLLFIWKAPLQGAHWDAPIYLQRGKVAAETPLLNSYRQHAVEIAAALPQYKPGVVDTPYWGFMRLGHTMLLGVVTTVYGANLTGLTASVALYTLMFACTVAAAGLLTIRLFDFFAPQAPRQAVLRATVLSACLYVASDISRYLAGNLVAEIPSMLFLTLGALLLVESSRRNNLALAMFSGLAAFAVFVTKMELAWGYVVFFLLFGFAVANQKGLEVGWRPFAVAALMSLALYGTYAWCFYPLAGPRAFLLFAFAHQGNTPNPVAPIKLWVVAGGLLWVGCLLAVRHGYAQRLWWFILVWLVLITLPYYDQLVRGGPAQARFFAPIMLPLMAGSTMGWARLLRGGPSTQMCMTGRVGVLMLVVSLIAVSHQESYRVVSALPGAWRVQHVKSLLSPPAYEQIDYPVDELMAISRFLYGNPTPTIVVLAEDVPEEYSNIIAYFGRRLPSVDTLDPRAESWGTCGRKTLYPALEAVMFCTVAPTNQSLERLRREAAVLRLDRSRGPILLPSLGKPDPIFVTKSLTLTRW